MGRGQLGLKKAEWGEGEGDFTSDVQLQRLLFQIPPALKTVAKCLLSLSPSFRIFIMGVTSPVVKGNG